MKVVVVESPSKAKTINKYLGADYHVVASYGHVRDLPSKNGSVDPQQQFHMSWEVEPQSKKHITEIIKALKNADQLLLATDPDREGEAISWHLKEVLEQEKILHNIPVKRIVFHEITKKAVLEALKHPRDLKQDLIEAYLARRALDYLVGFTLSPLLWRKLPGSKSAGRVQSVALRLIAERESEIEVFKSQEYWSIGAEFHGTPQKVIPSKLVVLNNKKLGKFDLSTQEQAITAKNEIERYHYTVSHIEKKQVKRYPSPPFTTSTLQQEASRKLGYGARKTMQIAQRLYEGVNLDGESDGLITYMRTDSVNISPEALEHTRQWIGKKFGDEYLPKAARLYKSKAKNAQEAHEGIRPTVISRHPETVRQFLEEEQFKLYELIWKRMVASQMENALIDQVSAEMANPTKSIILRANGSAIAFDGFLKLYEEGQDDETLEEDRILPPLEIGESLQLHKVTPQQHFTQPPPRYSEASLVKKLEELGIGRPSTYASIMSTLLERKYVALDKKRLVPQALGRLVTSFLTSFFKKYVEYDFTAHLEEQLDEISEGKAEWLKVMEGFWQDFNQAITQAKDLKISQVLEHLEHELEKFIFPENLEHKEVRTCPQCLEGQVSLKWGKWGAFVGCSNYPTCTYTRRVLTPLSEEEDSSPSKASFEPRTLGVDPQTQAIVSLKKGPYGFYLEWTGGTLLPPATTREKENNKKQQNSKPKRVALPRGIAPQECTLEQALKLGALPRMLGNHPDTNEPVIAAIGRFGPYLKHKDHLKSLTKDDNVLDVSLERALELLAQPRENKKKKAPFTSKRSIK
jgi:DNA topoisomerase-1